MFHQPGGLSAFVEDISEGLTRTSPVVAISGEKDGISADIVFLMTEDGEENIIGFTNNITNPEGGTHVTGFKTGSRHKIRYAGDNISQASGSAV